MLNFSEPLLSVVLGELMDAYVPSAFYLADELLLAMWVFCPIKSPSSPGLLISNCRGWVILPSIPMWSGFGSDPCVAKPKLEFTIGNLHGCTLTCSEFKLKTQTGILLKWAFDPGPMSRPIHSHYCKFYTCLLQGCAFSTELGFLNMKPRDLPDIHDIQCLWVVLIIQTRLRHLSIVWVVKTFNLLLEDTSLSQTYPIQNACGWCCVSGVYRWSFKKLGVKADCRVPRHPKKGKKKVPSLDLNLIGVGGVDFESGSELKLGPRIRFVSGFISFYLIPVLILHPPFHPD